MNDECSAAHYVDKLPFNVLLLFECHGYTSQVSS